VKTGSRGNGRKDPSPISVNTETDKSGKRNGLEREFFYPFSTVKGVIVIYSFCPILRVVLPNGVIKQLGFIEKVVCKAKMQKKNLTNEAELYETEPNKEDLIQTISDSQLLNAQSVLYKLCTQCSTTYINNIEPY
jgi:hypothetical protein